MGQLSSTAPILSLATKYLSLWHDLSKEVYSKISEENVSVRHHCDSVCSSVLCLGMDGTTRLMGPYVWLPSWGATCAPAGLATPRNSRQREIH